MIFEKARVVMAVAFYMAGQACIKAALNFEYGAGSYRLYGGEILKEMSGKVTLEYLRWRGAFGEIRLLDGKAYEAVE